MDAEAIARRSRLLEFLKFRVLAAQSEFFEEFRASRTGTQAYDPAAIRGYLHRAFPEALALEDGDLVEVFVQARRLYLP